MGKALIIALVLVLVLSLIIVGIIFLVKYYEKVGGPLIDIFGIVVIKDRFPGDSCDTQGNCVSGCCISGYCTYPVADGQSCTDNCNCGKGSTCSGGTCIAQLPDGAACDGSNSQCENNVCAQVTTDQNGNLVQPFYVCCPSGADTLGTTSQYCTDQPSGSGCLYDRVCGSGQCTGQDASSIPPKIGTCV